MSTKPSIPIFKIKGSDFLDAKEAYGLSYYFLSLCSMFGIFTPKADPDTFMLNNTFVFEEDLS